MTASSPIELSIRDARKLIVLAQGLHRPSYFGSGLQGSGQVIEKLGYIQIDTISVVARAHLHTLWSRNKGFTEKHLAYLQESGAVFEYWAHAAAFLPISDYRFSLPRKQAYANGDRHWHAKDPKVEKRVLDRIKAEGPLQAKDFAEERILQHAWGGIKPAKIALERLFMEGELMVAKRNGFQKVFDLTERVIAPDVDTSMPSERELCEHLIRRFLAANSIGTPPEMAYLRKGLKRAIAQVCRDLHEQGDLVMVSIKGAQYYALADFMKDFSSPLSRNKVAILSPFDNLLIQRKRMNALFDFDYLIECYVPAAKRQFGYFCLPLLWGREFAGRLDAKIDRKSGTLRLVHLVIETRRLDDFVAAFKSSLHEFLRFNNGSKLEIERVTSVYPEHRQKDLEALKLLLI